MTPAHIAISVACTVDVIYGLFVYLTNPRRATNQLFAILTLFIALWLVSQWNLLNAVSPEVAEIWIRPVLASTLFIPLAFNAIRMSMKYREMSCWAVLKRSRAVVIVSVLVAVWCFSDFAIERVILPAPGSSALDVPEPVYGPGFFVFKLYHLVFLVLLIRAFVRDTRNSRGIWRSELQYLMFGSAVCCVTAVVLSLVIPGITGNSRTAPLAPVAVILLNVIIAYGIATRRIMGVGNILRRSTAYTLLTIYLVLVYLLVSGVTGAVFELLHIPGRDLPSLIAALVVAFSLAPAHGRVQRMANLLFVNTRQVDVGEIVRQATGVMQSISTLDDLLENFVRIVRDHIGSTNVVLLLANDRGTQWSQAFPEADASEGIILKERDPLVRALSLQPQPLVLDSMRRLRLSPLHEQAAKTIARLESMVAVGIRSKQQLRGVMLLGERMSGKIYGAAEEDALRILGNELGVALENSKLYTEARNSQLYNDILLDNLSNGIVATDRDLVITACNREAGRILNADPLGLAGTPVEALPTELAAVLRETLEDGQRREGVEILLARDNDASVHLSVTASVFYAHTGEVLGSMAAFQDVTNLKHLQVQIRRSDRLASMGTLSAGMAHEIKNPLVTIKTFTQLLPERFEDVEFRETFQELVGKEVKRIDRIVNQLLTFSRPSKPRMEHASMHEIIEDSLNLVGQELRRNRVDVYRHLNCKNDHVLGDADLLSQAFVNFFLNAQESMARGGTLRVTTRLLNGADSAGTVAVEPRTAVSSPFTSAAEAYIPGGNHGAFMVIEIADTGSGIEEENLVRIFDPFFTTKSTGTGLGLSVAHGIITEQGGLIDVESQSGKGTAFIIQFPTQKEAVAV